MDFYSEEMAEMAIEFVAMVKVNPHLWDRKHQDFKNVDKRTTTWNQIGSSFNISGSTASNLLGSYRQKYVRERKNERNDTKNGTVTCKKKQWYLMEHLTFLDEVIIPRRTHAYFPAPFLQDSLSTPSAAKPPKIHSQSSVNIQQRSTSSPDFIISDVNSLSSCSTTNSTLFDNIPASTTITPTNKNQFDTENESKPIISCTSPSNLFSTTLNMTDDTDYHHHQARTRNSSNSSSPVSSPLHQTITQSHQFDNVSNQAMAKRKRKIDLDELVTTMQASVSGGTKDEWSVKPKIKYFCKYLGHRMDSLSDEKCRDLETKIFDLLSKY